MKTEKQQAQKLLQESKAEEAISLIKRYCDDNPNDAEALYILGQAYSYTKQFKESKKALKESIKNYPYMPWSHYALAGALQTLGELDDAIKCLKTVLSLDKSIHEAELAIVNIHITQGKLQEAQLSLENLKKIIPDSSKLYIELSRIEQGQGNQDKAVLYLEKALQKDENSISALCGLATIKTYQANQTVAKNYYERALKLSPGNPNIISGLAMVYSYQGDHKKAGELILPLLERNIRSMELGKVFISICRHIGKTDQAVTYVHDLLENFPMSKQNRSYLFFELGRELDRLGCYDEAFYNYKQGNALSKKYYNENENIKKIDKIISSFSKKNIATFAKASHTSKRPIFIIGMPRSGTSLTEQILAAHKDISAGGELQFIGRMAFDLPRTIKTVKPYPECVELISKDQINGLANEYLNFLASISASEKRVTNKMPRDFYDLGLISLLFPNAYIIHCQRKAIDNCLSIYFQNFAERGNAYATDQKMITNYYMQYRRLMKHWGKVLPMNILNLQYEDLVNNQEEQTRRILNFCDLEWDKNCIEFYKLDRTIATASFDQVRRPLYKKSVARWKNYQKHIDVMVENLKENKF
ncbi:hypothetical protein MNBD_GAMMA06-510 [hydrothermal vent metagenome]|uniref:Uncharacterized protein n=1 Tax=hydrothermal vent metagenome TaxID=652676 RepID=A0A3B0WH40_9ZZZZ